MMIINIRTFASQELTELNLKFLLNYYVVANPTDAVRPKNYILLINIYYIKWVYISINGVEGIRKNANDICAILIYEDIVYRLFNENIDDCTGYFYLQSVLQYL